MSRTDASRGLNQVHRITSMCNFLDHPAIQEAVQQSVPCTMPQTPGGLGFDISLWVGLGVVGLWSALDAYAERSDLRRSRCSTCGRQCLVSRFMLTKKLTAPLQRVLEELEDLRHLYAHNFAGQADTDYFRHKRHVLAATTTIALSCGAQCDGHNVPLDIPHLRYYAGRTHELLQMFA